MSECVQCGQKLIDGHALNGVCDKCRGQSELPSSTGSPSVEIRALTLTQPWATLVAAGAKLIETRSWGTSYRGPLAIHAAKGFPPECRRICNEDPFFTALRKHVGYQPGCGPRNVEKLVPLAAVVATCELVDCVRITAANTPDEPELSFGDYTPGRFAWKLANVVAMPKPIPAKGSLGLWAWRMENAGDKV